MNRLARWQLSLRRKDEGFLFDGDDAVFKTLLPQTSTYAEYGVGKSSLWVLANTPASIFAVDTSSGVEPGVVAELFAVTVPS